MRREEWSQRIRVASGLLAVLLLVGCSSLPPRPDVGESYTKEPPAGNLLAASTETLLADAESGESGYELLVRNDESLLWRLALADSAQHTLDIQYFIWHGDRTGTLLTDRVMRAADRGVRVRVLVDDFTLGKGDDDIVGLDRHPNVEVRTYNPWATRKGAASRGLEFAGRIKKMNTRMHNKLMAADNRMAIVGGRNIGDEYFGLATKYNFYDLDLLVVGPAVGEMASSFDLYWNSEAAYPAVTFEKPGRHGPGLLEEQRRLISSDLDEWAEDLEPFGLEPRDWSAEIAALADTMAWGPGRVVYDEPVAGVEASQLLDSLDEVSPEVESEVLIISAYFVPDEETLEWFEEWEAGGVRVGVLTNSLGSVDMPAAHSGYKPLRRDILETGAELFELRWDAAIKPLAETPPHTADKVGLHSKAVVADGEIVFIGSLNYDPRSMFLNTEMGLLIDSPELGRRLRELFVRDTSGENAWRVGVDADGNLFWDSGEELLHRQPAQGSMQRLSAWFLGILPLKSQV